MPKCFFAIQTIQKSPFFTVAMSCSLFVLFESLIIHVCLDKVTVGIQDRNAVVQLGLWDGDFNN